MIGIHGSFKGFPKSGVFFGVLIVRIVGGLFWGPPVSGNYHIQRHVGAMYRKKQIEREMESRVV